MDEEKTEKVIFSCTKCGKRFPSQARLDHHGQVRPGPECKLNK